MTEFFTKTNPLNPRKGCLLETVCRNKEEVLDAFEFETDFSAWKTVKYLKDQVRTKTRLDLVDK